MKMSPRKKKIQLRNAPDKFERFAALFLLGVLLVFPTSCGTENDNTNQQTQTTAKPEPTNEFEIEIAALRTADYTYIFSFKRKDGKPMNVEDKRFVKENSHFNTNRFRLNKDETIIFAGSNYKFEERGLAALKKRFEVGDFSKPEKPVEKEQGDIEQKNANTNS